MLFAAIVVPFLVFGKQASQSIDHYLASSQPMLFHSGAAILLLGSDPLLPIPSSIILTWLGSRFGFWLGAAVGWLGLTVACLFGYWLGRAGRFVAPRLAPVGNPAFRRWVSEYGIAAMMICRPVPVLAEASLIILGTERTRLLPLLAWASAVNLVLASIYAAAGAFGGLAGGSAAAIAIPAAFALLALFVARSRPEPDKRPS